MQPSRTYVRSMSFICRLPANEFPVRGWGNKSCFIKTHQTNSNMRGLGSDSARSAWHTCYNSLTNSGLADSKSRHPCIAFSVHPPYGHDDPDKPPRSEWIENRRGVRLGAAKSFPGVVISLATRGAWFWLDVHMNNEGRPSDHKEVVEQFRTFDLSDMWEDNPRERTASPVWRHIPFVTLRIKNER
ncbi:hypothetical protein N657DRAFT_108564 [Parathielavia appendiculata]|uniref:Uncharacterized protein n=1 Tax=Parathielavia appendiculata TaxID=2587402 RepID=A0AAN6Z1L1_9PEZI|nr:hypothetical protein N657DRAFT_108564 [Parathielavia appendiculata]